MRRLLPASTAFGTGPMTVRGIGSPERMPPARQGALLALLVRTFRPNLS